MTELEKLIKHSAEQSLALNKATGLLVNAMRQIGAAQATIERLQGEVACLRLDLAEERAGRDGG